MKKFILPAIMVIALTGTLSACTVYEDIATDATEQAKPLTYTSAKYNLSFEYPLNYKVEEITGGLAIYDTTANPTTPRTNMLVKTKTLDEVTAELKAGVDIKLKEEGIVALASGTSAKKLIFTTTGGMMGAGVDFIYYVMTAGSNVFVFQGDVGDGTNEKIFKSVSFIAPTAVTEKKPEEKTTETTVDKKTEETAKETQKPVEEEKKVDETKAPDATVTPAAVAPSLEVK